MALFAAALYYDPDRYWSDDDESEHMPGYGAFIDAARTAGVFRGGQALEPATASLVRVEVADRDQAVRWARRIPAAWRGRVGCICSRPGGPGVE